MIYLLTEQSGVTDQDPGAGKINQCRSSITPVGTQSLRPLELRTAPSTDLLQQNSQSTLGAKITKIHNYVTVINILTTLELCNYTELVQSPNWCCILSLPHIKNYSVWPSKVKA